jgi:hypothetical protein
VGIIRFDLLIGPLLTPNKNPLFRLAQLLLDDNMVLQILPNRARDLVHDFTCKFNVFPGNHWLFI